MPSCLSTLPKKLRLLLPAWLCLCARLQAVTLDELTNDARMTPKRFASHFGDFDFEPHDEVQAPEVFLRNQRGDCDDYAILADFVLKSRAFGTRLIHIRLVGQVAHAICYVTQSRAYLDYNNRIYFQTLERCGPTIREMAETAATAVRANWTSASEFTYRYDEDRKHFGVTVVKTEPPEKDPDRERSSAAAPN